jgi:hypothetical protein
MKYQLLAVNLTSFAMAIYFFIRHNSYCEPYGKYHLIISHSKYRYDYVYTGVRFLRFPA